jgi:branched-subunit amino acid aminotransferase/4-amino-4-deoxychorismate lyase
VSCGLLAGTFRQHLLDRGEIEESVVTVDELRSAHRLYLVNSVRRWMNAELIDN